MFSRIISIILGIIGSIGLIIGLYITIATIVSSPIDMSILYSGFLYILIGGILYGSSYLIWKKTQKDRWLAWFLF